MLVAKTVKPDQTPFLNGGVHISLKRIKKQAIGVAYGLVQQGLL